MDGDQENMTISDYLKNPHVRWFNIFIRDALLVMVMIFVNYLNNARSWWVGFITGALVVLLTWHLADYLNYIKLENGLKL